MSIRIGHGYDVHPLKKKSQLILGGVTVPSSKGAVGHSDADVLIHAISDALLGALNLGDIGHYFSSKSEKKGFESKVILTKVYKLMKKRGYKISNIDATIVLQRPKVSNYVSKMAHNIAELLKTKEKNISIKSTTTDKLGYIGKVKGVAAHAVVLIKKIP